METQNKSYLFFQRKSSLFAVVIDYSEIKSYTSEYKGYLQAKCYQKNNIYLSPLTFSGVHVVFIH